MYQKRFYVRIDLQLHAITCPGVWLCTHGYLEATLKTLGYYFRTGAMEPHFPLFCHDTFTIEGYFKSITNMDELDRVLAAERVEITLWQHGRRLAHFVGKLSEILQATGMPKLSCAHNINVQLLMKPTAAFPGIIAPKVELSTAIGVQDRLADRLEGSNRSVSSSNVGSGHCSKYCHGAAHFVTPSFVTDVTRRNRHCQVEPQGASCLSYLEDKRRQKPVCHAKGRETPPNSNNVQCPQGTCPKFQTTYHSRRGSNSSSFEADMLTHKQGERRLSNCSGTSFTLSHLSQRCNSCCSHSSDSAASLTDEHQRSCRLCQSYRQTFG